MIFLKQCVPRTSYHGYCCYFEVIICLSFCKEENNCKYITFGTRRSQLLASIQMDTLVSRIHDKLPLNPLWYFSLIVLGAPINYFGGGIEIDLFFHISDYQKCPDLEKRVQKNYRGIYLCVVLWYFKGAAINDYDGND